MKNAQGAILADCLYVGGGYTGSPKTDATVYIYDIASCKWTQLPAPCPSKWAGLAMHRDRLVTVGGKLMQCRSTNLISYTNKVAVWNERSGGGGRWEYSLPPMSTGRLCPTVISHHGCLIVAGGNKGSLDYHVEVLHADAERWMCGPSPPLPCYAHTSTVVGGEWYLMDQRNGEVQHANIGSYIAMATGKHIQDGHRTPTAQNEHKPTPLKHSRGDMISFSQPRCNGAAAPVSSKLSLLSLNNELPQSLWKRLPNSPPQIPFRIASTSSQLLALSNNQHGANITVHIHQDNLWTKVEGRFPSTLGSGLLLGGQRDQDTLYVLGGQVSHHYTNSAHKLALTTLEKLKVIKKSRQLQLLSE